MNITRSKLLKASSFFIGWPISILSLYFLYKITSPKVAIVSGHVLPLFFPFAIGMICFLIYFLFRTILWRKILEFKGYKVRLKESAFLWAIAELSRFIPGYIWAPFSKTFLFSKQNVSKKAILNSIIAESQLISIGSVLVSLLSFPFLSGYVFKTLLYKELIVGSAAVSIIFLTTLYVFQKRIPFRNKLVSFILPYLAPSQLLVLILLSFVSFFFFGVGTYFTIASFVFLSPQHFIDMIGFFAFSYVIGFFFLIAPMGLGIREGAMVIGLSTLMSESLAGFAALAARLALIIAELIFFVLSYAWKKSNLRLIEQVSSKIIRNKHLTILFFLMFAYILYFTSASFLRHDNFYTGRFDLGNMDQTVWNTLHGSIFKFTDPDGVEVISRLSFHADFILVLLAPLYALWDSPKMLLLIQTVIIASGAFFVYKISGHVLKNKTISLIFGVLYLLNPSLNYTNLYDFHAVNFATTFLLAAFYYLFVFCHPEFISGSPQSRFRNKFGMTLGLFFAILSGITKEQVWIIIAGFGLYIAIFSLLLKRGLTKSLFGFFVFLASLTMFYFLIWKAIPAVRGGNHHFALSYYSDLGDNPSRVVQAIVLSPGKILGILMQQDRIEYVKQVLMPLGFLSLLSPFTLAFAFPDFLINMLSSNTQFRQIYYQYTATITPFLFISAVYGVKRLRTFFPKISYASISIFLVITTLYASYTYGPLPGAQNPNIDMFIKPHPYSDRIESFLASISPKYSVAATNNVGAHVSHREKIFTIPIGMDRANIIIFLEGDRFAQPSPKVQHEMIAKLRSDPRYKKLYEIDNFVAFQKISNINYQFPIFSFQSIIND